MLRGTAKSGGSVLVTWVGFDPDDPQTGGLLRNARLEVNLAPKIGPRTAADVAELLGDSIAAIVSTDPFDRSVIEAAPRLRAISRVGVGTDSIDLAAATEAGVAVSITQGANAETTADHTLAMMLAAVRRVVEHDGSVRGGRWARAGSLTAWDLHDRTIGIVGFGEIGGCVARRLSGFSVEILVSDPHVELDCPFERVELDELLRRSDLVTLHAPLTEETYEIITARELELMGPNAILVNMARGGLVDEAALVDCLSSQRLLAAALDVFVEEPPTCEKLLSLPNVVLSPHVAGLSESSIASMNRQATQNVLDVLAGRVTPAVLNPDALLQAQEAER